MSSYSSFPWHTDSATHATSVLNTDIEQGLSLQEASDRLKRDGRNVLEKQRSFGVFGIIAAQFKNSLVAILLFAGIVTLFLQVYLDTVVIFIALLINVGIGTFQEHRASKAFEKLNESQEKYATVVRGGKKHVVSVEELVVGDIVVLEGGMYIPADMRLVSSKELSINEAVLTGEWVAITKEPDETLGENTPLAERVNMAWMGTLVVAGYGVGVVTATAEDTQMGAIATELQFTQERATPLQQSVRNIARFLVYVILAAVIVIFALGLFHGETVANMLLISIAIAVAGMPQGLPAAVTIVLAIGMEAILKKGGLVRNLLAAETLGSTTIILTDKTGTLTEARMRVHALYTLEGLEEGVTEAEGDNYTLLSSAILTTDAFIEQKEVSAEEDVAGERNSGERASERKIIIHGQPMEKALVSLGIDAGVVQDALFRETPRIDRLQFESSRRFSVSLHAQSSSTARRAYFAGVPELLLGEATHVYHKGQVVKMQDGARAKLLQKQKEMSAEGYRFIALSMKDVGFEEIPVGEGEQEGLLKGSVFLGLVAFADPVRDEVTDSIVTVKDAGVRVVMVTGDNPRTAKQVAVATGIANASSEVLTGADIDHMSDEELYKALQTTAIFARVLPEQKLHLARVLKDNGEVVAMTGDGVNDAPALQSADIGVAVGSGTEVAKAASDIVLLNNSFSIITAAIREGRRIIDNLKKITSYLIATSFSEIFVIGSALAVGAPIPLLPGQILWANIVEEGFMSFSFAFEKAEAGVMKRDPRDNLSKQILTTQIKKLIAIISLITGVFLVALYFVLLSFGLPIEEIRTLMFVALSLDSIFFAFSFKSLHVPIWKIPFFSNKYILWALLISITLLIAAITLPPLKTLLSLTTLAPWEVVLLAGIGLFNLLVIEITKYFVFERQVR